ncbi:ABC transporter substrate-binding protein [Shewanella sp. Isolate11]|uniref:ABC transporter substrate-binding protein n=1 Tax=Shewanella sp. Isolate11 TaxID=2908530 RepID=UPI001EFEA6AD|nr:ABC transporter substrate-binding protein [Shewanella sp. Isolate11]MCG9696618.1 ABC transporter substrate-binding protein [Shewanella sp. Isolate11]
MKIKQVIPALAIWALGTGVACATTVGFSQVGSESGWRTSFSEAVKAEAKVRGIDLKFSDAQQKQENQIKAVRSFIAQGVDAIIIAPVVETGWAPVLREAKRSRIPVVIVDRNVKVADNLYLTRIASDFKEEGVKIAQWLMDETKGECRIAEIQGTVGATASIDRAAGFNEVIAKYPNANIVRSQTGEFTRAKGKEVMESFLKAQSAAEPFCAIWAHNDEMALGAIQAVKEAGLKPGKDILVVSVDGVPDYFKAMAEGDVNATVELSPYLGAPAFDVIEKYLGGDKNIPKLISTTGDVYTQETAAEEYKKRVNK